MTDKEVGELWRQGKWQLRCTADIIVPDLIRKLVEDREQYYVVARANDDLMNRPVNKEDPRVMALSDFGIDEEEWQE